MTKMHVLIAFAAGAAVGYVAAKKLGKQMLRDRLTAWVLRDPERLRRFLELRQTVLEGWEKWTH